MNFNELVNNYEQKFPPFHNSNGNTDIRLKTNEYLNYFIQNVKAVNSNDFISIGTTKEDVINQLSQQKTKILNAIQSFLNGDIAKCHNIIYDTYFKENIDDSKLLFYKKIPQRGSFYRLRVNETNKLFLKNEMFHIPFESITKVGNQRFSYSGYPCLYLGNSSYACWEELEKPNLDKCNFSILGNETNLSFFDLTPPKKIKTKDDILRFPLIISCSIKFSPSKSDFKPEYIIPQSVFHSLIRFNNNNFQSLLKKEYESLDGIIYLSTHISHDLMFSDLNNMYNYVVPTRNNSTFGHCKFLSDIFMVSDSASIKDLWLRYPQIFNNLEDDIDIQSKNNHYDFSVFNIIEKFLKSTNVDKGKINNKA